MSRSDVHHGYAAAPWLRKTEAAVSAQDSHGRTATAIVRSDRAHHRLRHHQTQNNGSAARRPLYRQWAESVDVEGAAFGTHAAAGAHHFAARRNQEGRGT